MGVKIYRSALGNNQYQLMPFTVPNQTLAQFMDGFYKQAIMPEFGRCAKSIPQFDKWVGPLKKGTYTMTGCQAATKQLPAYFHPGFYKFQLFGVIPNILVGIADVILKVSYDYS